MAKQTFTTGQILTAAQMTSLQETAMGGGAATAKTTSYVLVAADAGTTVAMNSSGATTITVNTGLFAAGDTVFIQNLGTGVCTITAGTATVNSAGSLALPQYDGGILYFTSASAAIFYDYIQAGMTSPLTTKGDLWTYTTTDARLASSGVNGDVLTVDTSTATGLKWAAPASGGMTELATGSLTSTSVTISAISGSYKDLVLVIRNYRPTTTDLKLMMRVNGSSSAIYKATPGTFTAATTFADTETFISTTADGGAASQALIYVYVPDYANTASWKFWRYESLVNNETTNTSGAWEANYGLVKTTSAITSITLLPQAGGSFSSGTYILYGVK